MKPILFLAATVALAPAAPDGEQLFATNCSACHMLDQMVVGPSLAEIRTLYDGKPDEFVKWTLAPQKKRAGVIEMPSMVHVGEEGLREIYTHVMKISKGVTAKKREEGDPFAAAPGQVSRPQVQRMFMPDAGPAAIAIALDETTSLCWDAGECRLRYAWTGGFINGDPYWKGNGSSLAKINGNVRYTETDTPFPNGKETEFLGYGMKAGLPVFRYRLGAQTMTETFATLADGEGFSKTVTAHPAPTAPLTLKFPSDQKVSYSSDKGKWNGSSLTLQPADASEFTISFSFK